MLIRWMRLSTYMSIMSHIYDLPTKLNATFDFDKGLTFRHSVKVSDIGMKTATIVMFDRWSAKRALAD